MILKLSPKTRHNLSKIIPFGVIWLLLGCIFMIIEEAATWNQSTNPESVIDLNPGVVIFALIAVSLIGLLIGTIEVIFLKDLFHKQSFVVKIIYKLLIYIALMILITSITYPIAASIEMQIGLFDSRVWHRVSVFLLSITFLSTLFQMGISILTGLIYAGISDNLGHAVLVNFFTGKYHRPREEERIFMFLDMKSSTAVAEQLGHIQYFDLLQTYYSDLTNAIINHYGDVYQYIGDEVVISWTLKKGLEHNHCIQCFFDMKKALQSNADKYQSKYKVCPSFKAGMHCGPVTTGEIGDLKREIIFTGDVLNVTARIQGMCNELGADLLVSGDLKGQLAWENGFEAKSLGEFDLRGRKEKVEVWGVE